MTSRLGRRVAKAAFALGDFPYRTRPGPRILIYHQVGAGLGRQMEVTVEDFEFHLSWLAGHSEVVDLDTAVRRRNEPGADRLVVLTFDDGYEDLYTTAFPRLRAAGFPFTVYVTTGPVEDRRSLEPGGRAEPVTWDQMAEMAASGATIGAHTHTHPDLRAIGTDEITDEIGRSNDLIERRTGAPPEHFAYPYGYWARQADEAVRSSYRTATLGGGPPVTAATDPFLMHRIPVQLDDGRFFFVRKIRSGMRFEEVVRRRLTGYRGL